MADSMLLAEHWVAPTVNRVQDGQAAMHVSLGVDTLEDVAEEELDVELWVDDQQLAQLTRPGVDNPFRFVEVTSLTAVGFFTFDDPDHLIPTAARVTFRGESGDFGLEPPIDQDPLVS